MKGGKYTRNLKKIQVSAIFHLPRRRNDLLKFTELCVEMPCWCSSNAHHHGREPLETSVTDLATKAWIHLEELIISTITVKKAKFPKMSHSYSLFNSWLGPRVNQRRFTQKLRNPIVLYDRTKNPFQEKICRNISS